MIWLILADAVLAMHVAFVFSVVVGLALFLAGGALGWRWLRKLWPRLLHLVAIAVVVGESWFGIVCPLTTWENSLRQMGGESGYSASFVSHWLQSLLYYSAPPWVFTAAYTAFFGLVLASWFLVPPQRLVDARKNRRSAP